MNPSESGGKKWRYFILGIFLSLVFLIILQVAYPYAFLRDDNFSQFAPSLQIGLRQMFSGKMPYFNMHQLAGVPLLEMGYYQYFYPLTPVSYFISHFILNNDFLFIDIYVSLQLLFAFIATFFLLNKLRATQLISLMGGLAYAFSGYLIIGSTWSHLSATAIFLPLIFLLHLESFDKPSKRKILLLGIIRGMYFYAGNVQYFIYTAFFEFLFILLVIFRNLRRNTSQSTDSVPKSEMFAGGVGMSPDQLRKVFVGYALSLVLTLIIALPLGILIFRVSRDTVRSSTWGLVRYLDTQCTLSSHPMDFVFGNLLPYPFYSAREPHVFSSLGSAPRSWGLIHYTGSIFFISLVVGAVMFFRRNGRWIFIEYPFLTLALIAAILSFGYRGLLNVLMIILPVWNSLFNPFKFALYSNFFIVLFGSQCLCVFLTGKNKPLRNKFLRVLFILFLILMLPHLYHSARTPFSYYSRQRPAETSHYQQFSDGRIIAYMTGSPFTLEALAERSSEPDLPDYFFHLDFASYTGLYSLHGLQEPRSTSHVRAIPLPKYLTGLRIDPEWLSEWGVKYIFLPYESLPYHPEFDNFPIMQDFEEERIIVLENPSVKPIVVCEDSSWLDFELLENGVSFTEESISDTQCTVSVVHNPNFHLTVNGESYVFFRDSLGRMTFTLSAGRNTVELMYRNRTFEHAVVLCLIIVVLFVILYAPLARAVGITLSYVETYWKVALGFFLLFMLALSLQTLRDINSHVPFNAAVGCLFDGGFHLEGVRSCVKRIYIRDIPAEQSALEDVLIKGDLESIPVEEYTSSS